MKSDSAGHGRLTAAGFIGLAAVLALGLAAAQGPPEGKDAGEMQILLLKHTNATDVATVVRQLMGPEAGKSARIVADPRTNALLVLARPGDLTFIKRSVESLDQPTDSKERQFKVLSLQHAAADPALEVGLQTVIPIESGRFSVDRTRRLVIVSGDGRTIAAAETYLKLVDRAEEKPAPKEMRLRVVWLASGLARKETPAMPADVKKAADELAALGITDLRMVSQTLINVTTGKQFSAQGVADLDVPCFLTLEGTASERPGGAAAVELSVNATRMDATKTPLLCRLSSQISAPLGHTVVLGVTPTDKTTSAFVVQLLPAK